MAIAQFKQLRRSCSLRRTAVSCRCTRRCVWLEDYLSRYPNILVVVSHSQDFLVRAQQHLRAARLPHVESQPHP